MAVVSNFVSSTSAADIVVFALSLFSAGLYSLTALVSAVLGFVRLRRGAWAAVLTWSIVPAAMLAFILVPGALRTVFAAADYVHFAVCWPRYATAVVAAHDSGEPPLLWFFWRDASGFLSGQTLVYLVYDQSDGLARPEAIRTAECQLRAQTTFKAATKCVSGPNWQGGPHHLFGHYYVVYVG